MTNILSFLATPKPHAPLEGNLVVSDLTKEGTRLLVNVTVESGEPMTFSGATILSDGRYIFSMVGQTIGSIWMTDGTDKGTEKRLTMDLTVNASGEEMLYLLPY
jgi:hypothetical protein